MSVSFIFKNQCNSMRANALRLVWTRKFVHTTDSKHTMSVSTNVMAQQFNNLLASGKINVLAGRYSL